MSAGFLFLARRTSNILLMSHPFCYRTLCNLFFVPAHKRGGKSTSVLRRNWLNVLAVCATVLGISTTIYFIVFTGSVKTAPPPILFGSNYNSDACECINIPWRLNHSKPFQCFKRFIAAGGIKSTGYRSKRMANILQFPT